MRPLSDDAVLLDVRGESLMTTADDVVKALRGLLGHPLFLASSPKSMVLTDAIDLINSRQWPEPGHNLDSDGYCANHGSWRCFPSALPEPTLCSEIFRDYGGSERRCIGVSGHSNVHLFSYAPESVVEPVTECPTNHTNPEGVKWADWSTEMPINESWGPPLHCPDCGAVLDSPTEPTKGK